MSYTARRLIALAEASRYCPRAERAGFQARARDLATYLIGRFA